MDTGDRGQIERIIKMEANLDAAKAAADALAEALDQYEAVQDMYYELEGYYGSMQWLADYEDDETGKIPEDIKRGVLSEDAVYDLVTQHHDIMTRLLRAVLRSLEAR